MSKRVVLSAAGWVVLTGLALLLDPVLGAFFGIFGGAIVVVVAIAGTWDEHPDFEQRELARARRRAAKRERNQGARAKDRARYQAAKEHQARRQQRQAEKSRPASS